MISRRARHRSAAREHSVRSAHSTNLPSHGYGRAAGRCNREGGGSQCLSTILSGFFVMLAITSLTLRERNTNEREPSRPSSTLLIHLPAAMAGSRGCGGRSATCASRAAWRLRTPRRRRRRRIAGERGLRRGASGLSRQGRRREHVVRYRRVSLRPQTDVRRLRPVGANSRGHKPAAMRTARPV